MNKRVGSHWIDMDASMDPDNKFPIHPEELEEGPAPNITGPLAGEQQHRQEHHTKDATCTEEKASKE